MDTGDQFNLFRTKFLRDTNLVISRFLISRCVLKWVCGGVTRRLNSSFPLLSILYVVRIAMAQVVNQKNNEYLQCLKEIAEATKSANRKPE